MVSTRVKKLELLSNEDKAYLTNLREELNIQAKQVLGYPCSQVFDYSSLYDFLSLPINNIGDPYLASSFRVNTHEIEKQVLDEFLTLTSGDKSNHWGYVTNGGTEGNMYGLFLARELLPQGIVYYSEETHYSVTKILRVLNLRNIMIRSQDDGVIDYDDLRETIRIYRDVPPIIIANIGTTMKGAVDEINRIKGILKELSIPNYYIHGDAALSGMILPFLQQAPAFDFSTGVDSIAISGHKMIGSPIPCGVVLSKRAHVERIARLVEYVGSRDTTISGSRNGVTPLFMWYAFKTKGHDGFRELVQSCIQLADFAVQALNEIGILAWRHPYSTTVVMPRLNLTVVKKWQLAIYKDISHMIIMPNVNRQHIESLLKDIQDSDGEEE